MTRTWLASVAPALCIVLLPFAVLGCAQSSPSGSEYLLDATRPGPAVAQRTDAVLEVRRFSIAAEFADRGLVYRTSEFQFETDAYRQFLVSPSQMITERMREWLARSEVFEEVLVQGSRLRPTHVLEGNILGLYGDFRDPAKPVAVLEMRCFLVAGEGANQKVVLAREYQSVVPVVEDNGENFIGALNACLVNVLTSLEADLTSWAAEATP